MIVVRHERRGDWLNILLSLVHFDRFGSRSNIIWSCFVPLINIHVLVGLCRILGIFRHLMDLLNFEEIGFSIAHHIHIVFIFMKWSWKILEISSSYCDFSGCMVNLCNWFVRKVILLWHNWWLWSSINMQTTSVVVAHQLVCERRFELANYSSRVLVLLEIGRKGHGWKLTILTCLRWNLFVLVAQDELPC